MHTDILLQKYESNLNIILESINIIENNINYEFDDPDKFYVYHVAKRATYQEMFKFGFEAYFLGKNVGNMYGRGAYTTTDLQSSIVNANRGEYGTVILKIHLLSYDKFLIWNVGIAKKVYGDKWRVSDQLDMIVPKEVIEEAKNIKYNDGSLYTYIIKYPEYTSKCALAVYSSRNSFRDKSIYDYINGLVFRGSRDGEVAVVKDVKNLVPLFFSLDFGKTWDKGVTEKTLKYTIDDFDVDYLYGKKYKNTTTPSNGYAKVTNTQNKINYIDKDGNEISETWLDSGGNFTEYEDNDGNKILLATINYNGHILLLGIDGAIYQNIDDEYPVCFSDELPTCDFD
jgi:hypothetical protein